MKHFYGVSNTSRHSDKYEYLITFMFRGTKGTRILFFLSRGYSLCFATRLLFKAPGFLSAAGSVRLTRHRRFSHAGNCHCKAHTCELGSTGHMKGSKGMRIWDARLRRPRTSKALCRSMALRASLHACSVLVYSSLVGFPWTARLTGVS